ncbi:hypothetical protein BH09GEM1_BH09GEM1_34850 [soil metagenome]
MTKKPKRVREPVMVYLDERDRALLESVVAKTGLARTELLRRGLRQIASQELGETSAGSAFEFLVDSASDQDVPADLSARPDHYLYAGGYAQWAAERKTAAPPKKRARIP